MMIRSVSRKTALLLTLLVGSCATVEPKDSRYPISTARSGSLASAVTGLKTVAIHPRGRLIGAEEADLAWSFRSLMDAQIQARFMAKGFDVVAPAKADMLVAYAIGASDQITDQELRDAFGITAGLDAGTGETRGAIVLAVVRRATSTALWRGSASGAARRGEISSDERDELLRSVINQLLHDLPDAR